MLLSDLSLDINASHDKRSKINATSPLSFNLWKGFFIMTSQKPRIETLALHAGHTPDPETFARAVPIYQTSSYVFKSARHAADLFALKENGYIYTRIMNPTTDVLEKRLTALHEGAAALCTASGMAAIFYTVAGITGSGQNIVSGSNLYGGTHILFENTLKRFGIDVRLVDTSNPKNVDAAIDENTRLVFTESIGNPKCNVDDLEAIAAVSHQYNIPFVIDNTVSPPPIFNPFSVGCDIAVYSLTKMIGGHGNSIGGAVVEKGDFDWLSSGKFPEITEPDPGYHGLNFWEALCTLDDDRCTAFCTKLRTGLLRDIGAALAPMNSFLILQGIETLPLRARAHCDNALRVAQFLDSHPCVTWTNYAGLESHRDYLQAKKYFPMGPGAVFGFGIKGGIDAGRKFIESVKLCSHLANILDAKTLVIQPATTTHSQLASEEQLKAGVSPELVRISVGIEHVEDIIADLDQALEASQK
jgi:O-acetylhomoserine (thiol)-lyase